MMSVEELWLGLGMRSDVLGPVNDEWWLVGDYSDEAEEYEDEIEEKLDEEIAKKIIER